MFHVAVAMHQPEKVGNRKVPFSQENLEFVAAVLNRVNSDDYAAIYHGATEYGVDSVAEYFAMQTGVKQKQFPAYWFDPTKEKNLNRAAGIASRESMIRAISDATHNKTDEYGMLLVFHTQEDPRSDQGLKALIDFCAKYHPKIQVRTFRLPVVTTPKPETSVQIDTSPTSGIPDPFAVPQ